MTDDLEVIATVKLVRSKRTGEYTCDCDLGVHAEVETGFKSVDNAFEHAKRVVQTELASRAPEEPERDPHRDPSAFVCS